MNENVGFDVSQVLAQAAKATQESSEGSSSKYKLLYPQDGTLKLRLLYNPASGVVMRQIYRHKIDKKQVICLQNYGMDCPVCKTLSDIENMNGSDLWRLKKTFRGIAFAEYISSDKYTWDRDIYKPTPGEVVLFMFPWTIYQDLNRIIATAGDKVSTLIASNTGGTINIMRWKEGAQVKYRAEVDPYDMQHSTKSTDAEYNEMILNLPSLNDEKVPSQVTDNIISSAQYVAQELNRQYISPNVMKPNMNNSGVTLGSIGNAPQPAPPVYTQAYTQMPAQAPAPPQVPPQTLNIGVPTPQTPVAPNTSEVPPWVSPDASVPFVPSTQAAAPAPQQITPQAVPQAPTQSVPVQQPVAPVAPQAPTTAPECFGKHGTVDKNTCLICPYELQCVEASK